MADTLLGCPLAAYFLLTPGCSSDVEDYAVDMFYRWDHDGDGTWDTDFEPFGLNFDGRPASINEQIWRVRLQVKDRGGNVSEKSDSLDLSTIYPEPPDLIAGSIEVTREGSASLLDTVVAGERFCVGAWETCWMDEINDNVKSEYYFNGELVVEQWGRCHSPIDGCRGGGKCGLTIDDPGVYQIDVVMDAENVIVEVDETNNVTSTTITVIAPPNSPLLPTARGAAGVD